MVELCVIGCPRSGTGQMAAVLRACGMDVGHEQLGRNGISSWMWAVEDAAAVPYGPPRNGDKIGQLWMVTRNPPDAIASMAYTLLPPSWAFIRKHVGTVGYSARQPLARAMVAWASWTSLCLKQTDKLVRVEEASALVPSMLDRGPIAPLPLRTNARQHRPVTWKQLRSHRWLWPRVANLADMLGYQPQ